jgi:hypothetical protein
MLPCGTRVNRTDASFAPSMRSMRESNFEPTMQSVRALNKLDA